MSLFTDKYAPTTLSALSHNPHVTDVLVSMAQSPQLPHLILEGIVGSGKRTRVNLFLKEKYGSFPTSRVTVHITIPAKGNTKAKEQGISVLASRYHYQINPHVHGIYDKTLLQAFVTEIVQCGIVSGIPYRIIVIEEADRLSLEAQESLRKTLETSIRRCRFIFLSNREGRLIDPLRSRCIRLDVHAPTVSEISAALLGISAAEGINGDRSDSKDIASVVDKIAKSCDRDMAQATRCFEKYAILCAVGLPPDAEQFDPSAYDTLKDHCCQVIHTMITGSDLSGTMESVRLLLYALLNHGTDPHDIIPGLLEALLTKIPKKYADLRLTACLKATEYDESISNSSKEFYHIEAFCIAAMAILKSLMAAIATTVPKRKSKAA